MFWSSAKRMKRFLFVLSKPPHSGVYCQEMLDSILTTAAFDQAVALLLLDDAVFQLKKHQLPESGKDTAAVYTALELYGVTDVYVEQESLKERGLCTDDLLLPVRLCLRQDVAKLMREFDAIIGG